MITFFKILTIARYVLTKVSKELIASFCQSLAPAQKTDFQKHLYKAFAID